MYQMHVQGIVLLIVSYCFMMFSLSSPSPSHLGSRDGAVVEHAGLPPMWPGFDSRTRRHMWVEFVVGSRPCSERFFSGYSGFFPLLKNQRFRIPTFKGTL